jgi:DNA-binding FadR family transcriptional regulator
MAAGENERVKALMFRNVGSKERLVDRVVNEIEQLIIAGSLVSGSKLPAERDFAEQLGVSRTVVREASRILVTKGLLEIRPGVGTMIREMTSEQVARPLTLFLQTQNGGRISFGDLYQVRSILEVEIAGLAALQATAEEIDQLRQIVTGMEAVEDSPEVLARRDADFHSTLAKMTHNPLLAVLIGSIHDLLQEYVARVTPYLDPHTENVLLHYELFERIEARDVEGARRSMRENIEQMRRNSERYAELSQLSKEKE